MTAYCNPGDRLINKVLKAKIKNKYMMWVLQQTPDPVTGKLPAPTRSQAAQWAAEAMETIPPRMVVRSFVACRVTRPEDYSLQLRCEYGLDELMHSNFVRRMASLLADYPELQAQLDSMSDADDDEWLNDERTPHAQVGEMEEAEEWHPEESTESTAGGKAGASRQPASNSGKSKAAEKSKAATDTETFTELEVGESALAESHPPFAGIVGCDVCVLPAAFPNDAAPKSGMIGWRGEVTAKRGARSKGNEQIEVFGAGFTLYDRDRIVPVTQLEDSEAEESDKESDDGEEGEKGDGEEGEGSEGEDSDGSSPPPYDSSDEDEEQPVKRMKVSGAGAGTRSHVVDSSDDDMS